MMARAAPTKQVRRNVMRGDDRALYFVVELERDGPGSAAPADQAGSKVYRLADGSNVDALNDDEFIVRSTQVRLRKAD